MGYKRNIKEIWAQGLEMQGKTATLGTTVSAGLGRGHLKKEDMQYSSQWALFQKRGRTQGTSVPSSKWGEGK